jgi:hypothetical protein
VIRYVIALLVASACCGCGLIVGADDPAIARPPEGSNDSAIDDVVNTGADTDMPRDTAVPDVAPDADAAAPPNLIVYNATTGAAGVTRLGPDGKLSPLVTGTVDTQFDDVIGVPPNQAIFYQRANGKRVLATVGPTGAFTLTPLPPSVGWSRAIAIAPGRVLWYRKSDGAIHIDDIVSGALSTVYERPLGTTDDASFIGHEIAFARRNGWISLYTPNGAMWSGRYTSGALSGKFSGGATWGWTHFAPHAMGNMLVYKAYGTDPGLLVLEREDGINTAVWWSQPWPERNFDAMLSTKTTVLFYRRIDGRTRIARFEPDEELVLQIADLTPSPPPLVAGWTSLAMLE